MVVSVNQRLPFDRLRPAASHLPASLAPLVGREREARTACDLLRNSSIRLLTLTGPGGVGKTRLALEIARSVQADFPDGILFIPLADVHDAALVASTIAQAIGVHESGQRTLASGIAAALSGKKAMLVVDNFEHVLDAAPLLAEVLQACPALTCLVTSRALLRLSGEHAFPIPPLALPPTAAQTTADRVVHSPAVRLFVSRAQAVQPGLELTNANAADIERICRRLDGLPLAIELAAARARHLSAAELATHLGNAGRTSSLHMLKGGPRDAPDRQRAMRHAIAWSYDLLGPEEQALFRQLGVFVDGFTICAADAVVQAVGRLSLDVHDGVASLVDQSLLTRKVDPWGASRYGMLETIREFALDHLTHDADEDRAAHHAHAAHFLAMVEDAAPRWHEPDQDEWLRRTAAELANVRAALTWLEREGRTEELARFCWALHWFWKFQGLYAEGRIWYERALAAGTNLDPVYRQAMFIGASHHAWVLGDAARAEATALAALELARTSDGAFLPGLAQMMLAKVRYWQGEIATAAQLGDEAIALLRTATTWEGQIMLRIALNDVGINAAHAGQAERGITLLEEALTLAQGSGDRHLTGVHWSDLGLATQVTGDTDRAEPCFAEGLRLLQSAGAEWYLAVPLAGLASCAVQRDPERAARLYGAAEALRSRIGQPNWGIERDRDRRALAALRLRLGDDAFAREQSAGRALSLDDVVALALSGRTGDARAGAPRDGLEHLSARELDVLRLLVAGRSDREIADALFISRRTASKHVGSILSKFGVATRREAAERAIRENAL